MKVPTLASAIAGGLYATKAHEGSGRFRASIDLDASSVLGRVGAVSRTRRPWGSIGAFIEGRCGLTRTTGSPHLQYGVVGGMEISW